MDKRQFSFAGYFYEGWMKMGYLIILYDESRHYVKKSTIYFNFDDFVSKPVCVAAKSLGCYDIVHQQLLACA